MIQNKVFNEQITSVTLYDQSYARPPKWLSQFRAKIYLKQILRYVPIQPQHHILEVGCDYGQLTDLMRQHAIKVIGIDINPTFIINSSKHYLHYMDAQHLNFPNESFDLIVSSHTIEHIPDILRSLKEMARVLKPGGLLALIYPWEPIRGWTVLPEAILQYHSVSVCRQFHLHKFTPRKIDLLLNETTLVQRDWSVFYVPHPNFISVIQKYQI